MKFSIVTSFYNLQEFIEPQYKSLINQTYQNWEWIVTDDFSEKSCKDQLIEISKKDFRVKYVDQKFKKEIFWNPHKYVSYDSDFVLHIGADDLINRKTLDIYKHFFSENKNVFCLVSGGKRVHENGQTRNFIYSESTGRVNCDFRNDDFKTQYFITKCWRHIPYPVLDFTSNSKYLGFTEDFNILTTLEEIGDIMPINRNLSDITYRVNSLSNNPNNDHYEHDMSLILSKIDDRRQGKILNSIYDISNDDILLKSFYNLELGNVTKSLNFIKSDLSPKEKKLISKIYFEIPLKFNTLENICDINLVYITNEDQLSFFYQNVDILKNLNSLNVFCDLNLVDLVRNIMDVEQTSYGWFVNDYFWLKIGK